MPFFSRAFSYDWYLVVCWPCISLQILANNQPDAFFHVFIYLFRPRVSTNCSSFLTGIPSGHLHRLIIPDDVLIQFDLLMMSAVMLETCGHEINKYMKKCIKLVITKNLRNVLLNGWNSIWLQFSNKTTSYTRSKETYHIVLWSIFTSYQHTRYTNTGLPDCTCSHQINSTFY
jgi:hypothetical protein